MPIDCFFFLHINRPCIQIRFGDTEGLFYFPEVVICMVYLQWFHIQFRCHQKIVSCVFQILVNLCLVDFNYRLSAFSILICICDLDIFFRDGNAEWPESSGYFQTVDKAPSQEGTLSTVWNEISSYDLVNFMRDFRVVAKGDGTYINISRNQSVNEKIKKLIGLTNLDALYLTEKEIENIFEFTMLIDNWVLCFERNDGSQVLYSYPFLSSMLFKNM